MEDKVLKIKELVKELNEVQGYSISEVAKKIDFKIHTLSDLLREPIRGRKNIDTAIERLVKLKANRGIDINVVEYESVQEQISEIKNVVLEINKKLDIIINSQ